MSFPALDTYQSAANAALGAHSAPSAVASTTAIRPDPLTDRPPSSVGQSVRPQPPRVSIESVSAANCGPNVCSHP